MRPRALVTVSVCSMLLAGSLAAAPVAVAMGPAVAAPTVRAATHAVVFNHPVALTGTAPGRRVALLAHRFRAPGYQVIAHARVRHGRFHFTVSPTLATHYVVAGSGRVSGAVTVYTLPRFVSDSCNLCHAVVPRGRRVLTVTSTIRVPAVVYSLVAAEPVQFYYGMSRRTVRFERRVAQVPWTRLGHGLLRFRVSYPVRVPAGFRFQESSCLADRESRSGFGVPGGACGSPRLTRRQYLRGG